MLDTLRDPIWQFIGAFVAFMAILISVAVELIRLQHKDLSYRVISITPVLLIAKEMRGRLAVQLDEKSVQDLRRIVVQFMNLGNVPIRSRDYDAPVTFSFGAEVQAIEVQVAETSPATLQASVKAYLDGARVVVAPVLLNPEDSVTLDILVDGYKGLEMEGRITGVKDIREVKERIEYSAMKWAVILGLGALLMAAIAVSLGIAGAQILTLVSDILDGTVSQVGFQVLIPLTQDVSYRSGFLWGVALAGLTGFLARQLAYYYGKYKDSWRPPRSL